MLVKICCISSVEEAQVAASHGADFIGLVSSMPSGPGVIPESRIAEISPIVSGRTRPILLTSVSTAEEIVAQVARCGVTGVQLCEWLDGPERRRLREALLDAFLIQVVHVTGRGAIEKAHDAQQHVDALLLDSGTLTGSVIELGGTGRTHDWPTSAEIRRQVDIPVFLAGGLNPHNVGEAIREVEPAGVDVCSGLRRSGRLDPDLLASFMKAVEIASG